MKLEDMRGHATPDLEKMVGDAREELFKYRYQAISEAVENTKNIRALRKKVARIKTILKERAMQATATAATE